MQPDTTDWGAEFISESEKPVRARVPSEDATGELDAFAATPAADSPWTDPNASVSQRSRFGGMTRVGQAALVCSALALVTAGFVLIAPPPALKPAVAPPTPANHAPVSHDRGERAGGTPLAGAIEAPAPAVSGSPTAPTVQRSRPPVALRGAAARPARLREVEPLATPTRSPSPAPAATTPLAPDAEKSVGTPAPAEFVASVASRSGAPASSPTETSSAPFTAPSSKAPAEPTARELETRAIENALQRYRTAFNRLDVDAVSAVWPTVNEGTLARAFANLRFQNVYFSSCEIELATSVAEATCIGSARYEPIVGSRATKPVPRRWRFGLRKARDGWLIDRVEAR
ncbi:MAG: hypothetical protein ABI880_04445 [Acidobacteriota bacterium]